MSDEEYEKYEEEQFRRAIEICKKFQKEKRQWRFIKLGIVLNVILLIILVFKFTIYNDLKHRQYIENLEYEVGTYTKSGNYLSVRLSPQNVTTNELEEYTLFYKNENNEDRLVIRTTKPVITFNQRQGDEYVDMKEWNLFKNNLYIRIKDAVTENVYKVKLVDNQMVIEK